MRVFRFKGLILGLIMGMFAAQGCSRTVIPLLENRPSKDGRDPGTSPSSPPARVDAGFPRNDAGTMTRVDSGQPKPSESLRLTVYSNGQPRGDVEVVFHTKEGAFESYERTPRNGTLEKEIVADSMLTVLIRDDFSPDPQQQVRFRAFTYTGLQPGDHIELGKWNGYPDETIAGEVDIRFENVPRGLRDLYLDLGCGEPLEVSEDEVDIVLTRNCMGEDESFSVLAGGRIGRGGDAWYAHAVDQRLNSNHRAEIILDNWARGDRELRVRVEDIPSTAPYSILQVSANHRGQVYEMVEAQNSNRGESDLEVRLPQSFGMSLNYESGIAFLDDRNELVGYGLYGRRGVSLEVPTQVLSAPDDYLALVRGVTREWDNNLERAVISWEEEGATAAQADGKFIRFRLKPDQDLLDWIVILGSNAPSHFELPELPDQFADFRPDSQSDIIGANVILLEASFIDGFDEFRQKYGPDLFEIVDSRDSGMYRFSAGGDFYFDE